MTNVLQNMMAGVDRRSSWLLGILDMLWMAQICTENRNDIDIVQFWQCISIFQWVTSPISTLNFLQPKKNEVMHCSKIESSILFQSDLFITISMGSKVTENDYFT